MKYLIIIAVALIAIAGWLMTKEDSSTSNYPSVLLITNEGDIRVELYTDKTPKTAQNFIALAEKGYFDNTLFHRVIAGFMIQGGDPNSRGSDASKYGFGGPGYTIPDEFAPGLSNVAGTISMANAGPNTGGSQFFINVADNTRLDGKHTVFGRVIEGMDVVMKISKTPVNENDLPLSSVRIERIVIKNRPI